MIDNGIMIDETNIVDKTHTRALDSGTGFFCLRTRLTFAKLRQAFSLNLIFNYSDLKCHIRNKIDASDYTIVGVLN